MKVRNATAPCNPRTGAQDSSVPAPPAPGKLIDAFRSVLREEMSQIVEVVLSRLSDRLPAPGAAKPDAPALLDVQEAADLLRISKRKLETIIAGGSLPVLWIGGQRRIHPDTLTAFQRKCASKPRQRRNAER